MAAPTLSVLMPARDAAATLGAALASIRSQTLQDFELVAVEDASRDETGRLLAPAAGARPLKDPGGAGSR